jgi:hypothetical protein
MRRASGRTEDELMSGGVVWVCENGHVDIAHKTEGNHLDLCSRCKDGVCEPRRTLGRRSKAQRKADRDLGIDVPRRRRATRSAARSAAAPTGDADLDVRFVLTTDQRRAIRDGRPPRISFPRHAPADHPEGRPWPTEVGDVVEVGAGISIAVTALRTLVDEIVVHYDVFDSRSRSDVTPISTIKPKESATERMGGPEIRPEREPEWLHPRDVSKLANRVHEAELKKLRRTREELGHHLKEQASAPRDVRFHLRKSIEAIDRRIENIQSDMAA